MVRNDVLKDLRPILFQFFPDELTEERLKFGGGLESVTKVNFIITTATILLLLEALIICSFESCNLGFYLEVYLFRLLFR